MERQLTVVEEHASLAGIVAFVNSKTQFKATEEYDIWEIRQDKNGQMEKCVVIKKSGMHGVKLYFTHPNTVKLSYIIPNKILNVYFGEGRGRRNILQLITGKIKEVALAGSQKKAFEEISQSLREVAF